MEVIDVKHDIMHNTLKPVYVFTGVEYAVRNIYVDKIVEVGNYQKVVVDTVEECLDRMKCLSLLGTRTCYVVFDDNEFIKSGENIDTINTGDDMLILVCNKIDKRSKFYKQNKDSIVVFETLKPYVLQRYVQVEIPLNDVNTQRLLEVCNYDYGKILLEVDKIKQYVGDSDMSLDYVFNILMQDGTISIPPYDAVFDFVDAVLYRQPTTAFRLLQQCRDIGESTLVILTVMYNNTKQVVQVQSCVSNDIQATTGLTPWQIKCAKEKVGHYSTGELIYLLRLIRDVEKGIKTGMIDESVAVDFILTSVF